MSFETKYSQQPIEAKVDIIISRQLEPRLKAGNHMKGGNTPVSKSGLVLIFNMIKWEGGTSFFETNHRAKLSKTKAIMDFFDIHLKTALYV